MESRAQLYRLMKLIEESSDQSQKWKNSAACAWNQKPIERKVDRYFGLEFFFERSIPMNEE